jgi:hypothetical protein
LTATDFLYPLMILAVVSVWQDRMLLLRKRKRFLQLLAFMSLTAFWFDYVANHRSIWWFEGEWRLHVLLNPLENTVFTIVMTILVLRVYLGWESYIAKRSR